MNVGGRELDRVAHADHVVGGNRPYGLRVGPAADMIQEGLPQEVEQVVRVFGARTLGGIEFGEDYFGRSYSIEGVGRMC